VMLIRRDYDLEAIPELEKTNLVLINGDLEVTDGVRLFTTPGHTPGHQGVAVNTKKGVVAIVADQYHLACMAFPKMTEMVDMEGKKHKITPVPDIYGPFFPHNIIYNHYDWYDSAYKIKAIVEKYEPYYVLCGHEPSQVYIGEY
jgi:N-acyl homoserine lactone hydrolase